jgi:hypothetical protein
MNNLSIITQSSNIVKNKNQKFNNEKNDLLLNKKIEEIKSNKKYQNFLSKKFYIEDKNKFLFEFHNEDLSLNNNNNKTKKNIKNNKKRNKIDECLNIIKNNYNCNFNKLNRTIKYEEEMSSASSYNSDLIPELENEEKINEIISEVKKKNLSKKNNDLLYKKFDIVLDLVNKIHNDNNN